MHAAQTEFFSPIDRPMTCTITVSRVPRHSALAVAKSSIKQCPSAWGWECGGSKLITYRCDVDRQLTMVRYPHAPGQPKLEGIACFRTRNLRPQ